MPHDYSNDVPFDENPDDFLIGNVVAGEKSAEEIEKENSFSTVPPGDHLLVVAGFRGAPEKKLYTVNLNEKRVSFEAYSIRVRLTLPGDPKCSIDDYFLLPPDDPKALTAYYNGTPEGKKQAGWMAAKFTHFINRLGYPFPPGAPLPEAAKRLGNWKGRAIHATVEAGRGTYKDREGNDRQREPQIKSFSYRLSQDTMLTGVSGAGRDGASQSRRPAAAAVPGRAFAGSGLDNI